MLVVLLAALLAVVWPAAAHAHEIPRQVTIRMFAQPSGRTLTVLVRVPLEAMRDVDLPLRGPGYLDIARADPALRDAARVWIADGIRAFENGVLRTARVVAVRASLPTDGAFADEVLARRQLAAAPLAASVDLPWQQAMLDVHLAYDIVDAGADFAIEPRLARLGVHTTSIVRTRVATGAERVLTYDGDPGVLPLEPGALYTVSRYLRLGVSHIVGGLDHLLFLLCVVLPFRRPREVVVLATAFTVAHSLTLVASALGYAPTALWFPPLVETLIALSILLLATENMVHALRHVGRGEGVSPSTGVANAADAADAPLTRRWMTVFVFGLVHGFGFSFALRDSLQFAGAHLALSLAAFNIGVELAQLAVLAVALPALALFFRRVPVTAGVLVLSGYLAHTAWHWSAERWRVLSQYRVTLPALTDGGVVLAMQLALALLVAIAVAWGLRVVSVRWMRRGAGVPASVTLLLCAALGVAMLAPLRAALAQKAPAGAATRPSAKKTTTAASLRSSLAGVYTAEQATQGREVFSGNCQGCHTAASHTGAAFLTKWRGRPLDDLFAFLQNQMPKSAPGSLEESEYVMVTAYILQLNGMKPGSRELSAEPALLKSIRIDAPPTRAR